MTTGKQAPAPRNTPTVRVRKTAAASNDSAVKRGKTDLEKLLGTDVVSEDKATAMANKLLGKAKLEDKVVEKLKARASDIIQEVISHLDTVFEGMISIKGSGTEATITFKEEVIEGFYRADITEYRSQIEGTKPQNLFEMYYGPLHEALYYKQAVSTLTNRGSDLNLANVKRMTKKDFTLPALVFWAMHTIHEYVKNQGVEIKNLDFSGIVPIYSIMDFLKREKPMIVVGDGMNRYGGIFKDCKIQNSFGGPIFVVEMYNYVFHAGKVVKAVTQTGMSLKNHMVNKDMLPFSVPTEEEMELYKARGKKYFKYASTASYLSCSGPGYRRTYWSVRSYNCTGRVMIDCPSMIKSDPNYGKFFGISDRYGGINDSNEELTLDIDTLADEILYCASPYVYGFSMKSKQWVEIAVDSLNEINFVENAFDDLVLDANIKDIIRSLVESDTTGYTDIITSKGLGYIFLLSGGPGVGKTLTAEALAETLKRPIYYLTVGELGVNVEELEAKLKDVLEIAETWNAILLIDEIDIFVQKRGGSSDINRNAMTGVFLRLLEYYSGIMFLTTNLVENLDAAFLSRVSLNIDYGKSLNDETREQIWRNLTRKVTIEHIDYKVLSKFNLNGRRIKNCIKLLLSLSSFKGLKPSMHMLLDIIKLSENANEKEGYHANSGA